MNCIDDYNNTENKDDGMTKLNKLMVMMKMIMM